MSKPDKGAGNFSFDNDGGIENGNPATGPDGDNVIAGNAGDNASAIDGNAQSDGGNDARTTAEPPREKRKGGWPKGKPRKPRDGSDGPAASRSANAGASARMDREKESLLAKQIVAFHQIAAMMTQIPDLMIDESEGAMLARSIKELSDHYGPVITGPTMLWVNFAGVAAAIYVPRVAGIIARLKAMRASKAKDITPPANATEPDNVVQFPQGGATDGDPFRPGNIG